MQLILSLYCYLKFGEWSLNFDQYERKLITKCNKIYFQAKDSCLEIYHIAVDRLQNGFSRSPDFSFVRFSIYLQFPFISGLFSFSKSLKSKSKAISRNELSTSFLGVQFSIFPYNFSSNGNELCMDRSNTC